MFCLNVQIVLIISLLFFHKALCNCIKVDDPNNTTNLVLSSDHLLSPQTPKDDMDDNVKTFKQWWKNQVVGYGPDAQLRSLYLDLLAR